jgi:hypothetical protein
MNFLNECNGIHHGYAEHSNVAKVVLLAVYGPALEKFKAYVGGRTNHDTQMEIGRRCQFEGVLDRLLGFDILGVHAAMGTPEEWVLDALRDCASADYWYAYMKDYN